MEKEQRTRLQKATQDARRLLEEEFRSQLLQTYDIDVDKVRPDQQQSSSSHGRSSSDSLE
jgi:hypothetical protein